MEELLDNVLVLVPVALLIFLRVFGESARKRVEKAKKGGVAKTTLGSPSASPPSVGVPNRQVQPIRLTKPGRNPAPEKSPAREKPARTGLLARLGDYLSGRPQGQSEPLAPLHFEEEAARSLGQFAVKGPETQPAPAWASPSLRESLAAGGDDPPAAASRPIGGAAFPERLARLPPLQQALVMSEVLGKPKALQ